MKAYFNVRPWQTPAWLFLKCRAPVSEFHSRASVVSLLLRFPFVVRCLQIRPVLHFEIVPATCSIQFRLNLAHTFATRLIQPNRFQLECFVIFPIHSCHCRVSLFSVYRLFLDSTFWGPLQMVVKVVGEWLVLGR